MRVDQFDFELPERLIALRPAIPRDAARLLVVGEDGTVRHCKVSDLPSFFRSGDTLVVNDTKVIHARLRGVRWGRAPDASDAKIEVMLHKRVGPDRFLAFARPARKLVENDALMLGQSLSAGVVRKLDAGEIEVRFALSGPDLDEALAREGEVPLPPYIAGKRAADARDNRDYQTVYAAREGSVAAPTAGLHFTPELFGRLEAKGVARETVTLHVGAGTFLPVSVEDTAAHRMHAERAMLDEGTAARLNARKAAGGRIAAVGTTSLRTLESAVDENGSLQPFAGETTLFITPGYRFQAVDVLLTNFHLPRSTLFMLVCAFAGTETMKAAYAEAIREEYRFYSYGDACLLFRRR